MGDIADYELSRYEIEEELLNEYLEGYYNDNEAYELGLVDESGRLNEDGLKIAQNKDIMTFEKCQEELRTQTNSLDFIEYHICCYDDQSEIISNYKHKKTNYKQKLRFNFPELDDEALLNLFKDHPTCNCCREEMLIQKGKFGKFYFCGNKCESQGTISEVYWLKLKDRLKNI